MSCLSDLPSYFNEPSISQLSNQSIKYLLSTYQMPGASVKSRNLVRAIPKKHRGATAEVQEGPSRSIDRPVGLVYELLKGSPYENGGERRCLSGIFKAMV